MVPSPDEDQLELLHYVNDPNTSCQCQLCGKHLGDDDLYFDEPELLDVIAEGIMPMPMAMVNIEERIVKQYNICTTIHHQPNATGSETH